MIRDRKGVTTCEKFFIPRIKESTKVVRFGQKKVDRVIIEWRN